MDPVTQGAIIQSAGNVAAAGGNFLSNLFFGNRNERWAREDASTAFYRQRQLLAEQRAYESPQAQMQRYIDAGLNPNLIYGQQQASIVPPSVPQAQSASPSIPSVPQNIFSPLLDAELKKAQIRNLDKNNELSDAQVENTIKDTWLKVLKGDEVKANVSQIEANTLKLQQEAARVEQIISIGNIDLTNEIITLLKRGSYIDEEFEAYAASLGMQANEFAYAVATFDARVLGVQLDNDKLRSELRINKAYAAQIEKSLPYLDSLYRAQKNQAILDAGISAINYKINSTFATADKIFGYGRDVIGAAGIFMGGLSRALTTSPVQVRGFRP